jgi:hypothetical protein
LVSKAQGTFEWCGVSRVSAEVIGGTGRGPDPTAFLEAVFWLEDRLRDGIPHASEGVRAEAEEDGIAFRTLQRAKRALQVRSIKRGQDPEGKEAWDWQLPSLTMIPTPETLLGSLGTLDVLGILDVLGALHTNQRDRSNSRVSQESQERQERQERQVVEATPCPHCHGTDFWTGAAGQMICVRCHPQPTNERSSDGPDHSS